MSGILYNNKNSSTKEPLLFYVVCDVREFNRTCISLIFRSMCSIFRAWESRISPILRSWSLTVFSRLEISVLRAVSSEAAGAEGGRKGRSG